MAKKTQSSAKSTHSKLRVKDMPSKGNPTGGRGHYSKHHGALPTTGIGEITQDVTVNKAKTADKAFNAMDGYIRG